MISWLVLLIAVSNTVLTFLFGKSRVFILIISVWWFLWLFLSTFSLSGLFVPKDDTYIAFLTMLLSITFGGILYFLTQRLRPRIFRKNKALKTYRYHFPERIERLLLLLNYFFLLPLALFFFFKAIGVFISNPGIINEGYRDLVFSSDIIFPRTPLLRIFERLVWHPLRMASLIIGGAIFATYGRISLLLISSLLFVLEGITMAGRFQFYIIITIFISALICKSDVRVFRFLKEKYFLRSLPLLAILVTLIIYTTFNRAAESSGVREIFDDFVIGYHTAGFTLFDIHLNDASLMLGDANTYGRVSLGTIEWASGIFLRRFDPNVGNLSIAAAEDLGQFVLAGYDSSGKPILLNAFGTILYSVYMDGGIPLTLFLSSAYGFLLLKYTSHSLKKREVYSLSILLFLVYTGIFGIFQPLLMTASYWPSLFYLQALIPRKLALRQESKLVE